MKSIKTSLKFLFLAAILTLTSCSKDDENTKSGAFSNGIFIVNEGAFQTGTGTITYFNPDSNLVKQDIFEMVNGRPLGNIAQSMTLNNGKGYIVVNNAGTVEVVDLATFKSDTTIKGFQNPSQFLIVDATKAYVSDWAGSIAVVDLITNAIVKTISTGAGSDAMVKSGAYVYVANSGGLGVDSTVSVIDFTTDKVVKTIHVGDAPTGIVADSKGQVWVLCKGTGFAGWPQAGDTEGRLVRINPLTLAVDLTFIFPTTSDHPDKPVINKAKTILFFIFNNGIYRFNLTLNYPIPELFMANRNFYSLGYENKTGYLYATDAKNYVSNGLIFRIKADNATVVDSIPAGIIPRGFAFRE